MSKSPHYLVYCEVIAANGFNVGRVNVCSHSEVAAELIVESYNLHPITETNLKAAIQSLKDWAGKNCVAVFKKELIK